MDSFQVGYMVAKKHIHSYYCNTFILFTSYSSIHVDDLTSKTMQYLFFQLLNLPQLVLYSVCTLVCSLVCIDSVSTPQQTRFFSRETLRPSFLDLHHYVLLHTVSLRYEVGDTTMLYIYFQWIEIEIEIELTYL